MRNFENKIVWITGASSGIGEEMAMQLNKRGATIILSARRKEELERVKNALPNPNNAYVLPLDMANIDDMPSKVEEVIKHFKHVDLMFHNAGISQRSYIQETSLEVDRKLMEVNYFGTVALTKALLPHLQKQQESLIAVNSSLAGKFGFFERSAYSASKFALQGFFETLRLEEFENNIHVCLLCAVGIQTKISENALDGKGKAFDKSSALQEEGLSTQVCVEQMIKAIEQNKKEIIIGKGMQNLSTKIKELFPNMFFNMLKKRKP